MKLSKHEELRIARVSHVKEQLHFHHKDHGDVLCTPTELVLRYNLEADILMKILAGTKSHCDGWIVLR